MVEFNIMNTFSSPPTENMVEIKVERNVSGEESARSEAKRTCAHTSKHPSLPSLSISKMMSYIHDKNQGERDVNKGEVKR